MSDLYTIAECVRDWAEKGYSVQLKMYDGFILIDTPDGQFWFSTRTMHPSTQSQYDLVVDQIL